MFFVLAKILGSFAVPSNILIILGLLGIVLMATRFAGAGRLVFQDVLESDLAARMFASLGIEKSRIALEARARDTLENARFSKALADPKPGERWLLVTSAYHMPRSIGAFRRAGFAVEA